MDRHVDSEPGAGLDAPWDQRLAADDPGGGVADGGGAVRAAPCAVAGDEGAGRADAGPGGRGASPVRPWWSGAGERTR